MDPGAAATSYGTLFALGSQRGRLLGNLIRRRVKVAGLLLSGGNGAMKVPECLVPCCHRCRRARRW